MNTTRILHQRSIYRCLHTSPARRLPPQQSRLNLDLPVIAVPEVSREVKRPLDNVSLHRAEAIRRAQHARRRNWLALGAVLSMAAPFLLIYIWDVPPPDKKDAKDDLDENGKPKSRGLLDLVKPRPTHADSPRAATDSFQGKKVVVAAGDKIIAAPQDAKNPSVSDPEAIELVETGTSYVPYFPRNISLPTSSGPEAITSSASYTLIGLGIRKVSFLRVQVYVVGLYVKTADLSSFQNHLINTVNPTASALIPGEKEALRSALLDGEKSEKIWQSILADDGSRAVSMALRVVPTRSTDFKHLQDGWMRGVATRTDEVRRKQQDLLRQQASDDKRVALPQPVEENEFSDESFGLAMKEFKNLFQGRGKAPKGSIIVLTRDRVGALGAYYQNIVKTNKGEKPGDMARLGEVRDERVSRLLWQIYLGGKDVSSEDARRNIVDGCIHLVERPVGTVEGMVQ